MDNFVLNCEKIVYTCQDLLIYYKTFIIVPWVYLPVMMRTAETVPSVYIFLEARLLFPGLKDALF